MVYLLNLWNKWGSLVGLIFVVSVSFYSGYSYKAYLYNSASVKEAKDTLVHYNGNSKEYIDTLEAIQLEYENRIQELENDKTLECNAIAPKCLTDSF